MDNFPDEDKIPGWKWNYIEEYWEEDDTEDEIEDDEDDEENNESCLDFAERKEDE